MEYSLILCNCITKRLYGLDKVYVTFCSDYSLDKYKDDNKLNLIYCISNINNITTYCYINYNTNTHYCLYVDCFVAITKAPITNQSNEILCKERKLYVLINFNLANFYEIIICIN